MPQQQRVRTKLTSLLSNVRQWRSRVEQFPLVGLPFGTGMKVVDTVVQRSVPYVPEKVIKLGDSTLNKVDSSLNYVEEKVTRTLTEHHRLVVPSQWFDSVNQAINNTDAKAGLLAFYQAAFASITAEPKEGEEGSREAFLNNLRESMARWVCRCLPLPHHPLPSF